MIIERHSAQKKTKEE